MSKIVSKSWMAVLLVLLCLIAGIGSFQAEASTVEPTSDSTFSDVQLQAQFWADELAAKPGYKTWKGSSITVSPLGPGTHSWLAIIQNSTQEPVGYLVIHAAEDGSFQLGEYGTGSYPLFNEQSLQLSLLQLELIPNQIKAERVYTHPLHAAWRITSSSMVHYADAVSGEHLPISKDEEWDDPAEDSLAASPGLTGAQAEIKKAIVIPFFNPYGRLPWLTKSPITMNDQTYSSLLKWVREKKEIRFTVESYEGKLLQVWSVVGYDTWEGGQLYLALSKEESDDRRYMPIELLVKQGKFYR
ncbi:hypothetical protein D3P07_01645 [Paenibacillus sp. 1011MAR3C5]|uniref:hypothetical protein n=1 Tax=Paenibacillus sp. 1011MAR3C5 TaxID=1675787 RepID=UPI000E6D5142|nr:hypothetical protein [Paenibacillus sp. 1011MAR3C5]RJE90826.1 hypothetical protein D3P07_01645 [Paenibacillus sp. 1011MAR3C5]